MVCAWNPGDCKSWCRGNTETWVPTAFDIMGDVNGKLFRSFAVHIDVLSPDIIRGIVYSGEMDEHVADMHVENAESLGLDGVFEISATREDLDINCIQCALAISGLVPRNGSSDRTLALDDTTAEAWDGWVNQFSEQGKVAFADWEPKTVVIQSRPSDAGVFSVLRVTDPEDLVNNIQQRHVANDKPKSAVIASAIKMMGDDLDSSRFVAGRMLYSFDTKTRPWPYPKRKALATLLVMLSKETDGVIVCEQCLSNSNVVVWKLAPGGPKLSTRGGNIHVVLERLPPNSPSTVRWSAAAACSISIDLDCRHQDSPILIKVVTAW